MSESATRLVEENLRLHAEIAQLRDAVVLLRGALSDVQEHRMALCGALQALVDTTLVLTDILVLPAQRRWLIEARENARAVLGQQAPQETP